MVPSPTVRVDERALPDDLPSRRLFRREEARGRGPQAYLSFLALGFSRPFHRGS